MTRTNRTTARARWLALAAAAGVALAGCAAGSESGGDSAAAPSATQQGSGASAEDSAAGADRQQSGAKSGAPAATVTPESSRKLARTATLSLTVKDVEQTTAKIRSVADRRKGWVSKEESSSYGTRETPSTGGGRGSSGSDATPTSSRRGAWSEITLEVPVDALDDTMTELSDLGKVTRRTTQTEDVTAAHTDTATRVRTLEKSIKRVQGLIDSTDDLDQVIKLEDELSRREGDLEALKAQLKDLEDRSATSPVTISLTEEGTAPAAADEDETGFVAGLEAGWSTFTRGLDISATVLGALTPFLLTGAAVLGPVYLWWRRRRTTKGAEPA